MTIRNPDLNRYLDKPVEDDVEVRRQCAVLILLECARRDTAQVDMPADGYTTEEVRAYRWATADLRKLARELL